MPGGKTLRLCATHGPLRSSAAFAQRLGWPRRCSTASPPRPVAVLPGRAPTSRKRGPRTRSRPAETSAELALVCPPLTRTFLAVSAAPQGAQGPGRDKHAFTQDFPQRSAPLRFHRHWPELVISCTRSEEVQRTGKEPRVARPNRVLQQQLVPVRPAAPLPREILPIPDVSSVGAELKVAVDVHREVRDDGQRKEAVRATGHRAYVPRAVLFHECGRRSPWNKLQVASVLHEGRELIRELRRETRIRIREANLQARLGVGRARDELDMGIEEHHAVVGDNAGHVREMVNGIEAESESPRGQKPVQLGPLSDPGEVDEVALRERRVVEHVKRRSLQICHAGAQQGAGSIRVLVEHDTHPRRTRIICVLHELREDRNALRVHLQDVPKPPRDALLLPEALHRARVEAEVQSVFAIRNQRSPEAANADLLGGAVRDLGVDVQEGRLGPRGASSLAGLQPRAVVVHQQGVLHQRALAVWAVDDPVLGLAPCVAEHLHQQNCQVQLVRTQRLGPLAVLGVAALLEHLLKYVEVVGGAEARADSHLQEQVAKDGQICGHCVEVLPLLPRGLRRLGTGIPGEGHLAHRDEGVSDPDPRAWLASPADPHQRRTRALRSRPRSAPDRAAGRRSKCSDSASSRGPHHLRAARRSPCSAWIAAKAARPPGQPLSSATGRGSRGAPARPRKPSGCRTHRSTNRRPSRCTAFPAARRDSSAAPRGRGASRHPRHYRARWAPIAAGGRRFQDGAGKGDEKASKPCATAPVTATATVLRHRKEALGVRIEVLEEVSPHGDRLLWWKHRLLLGGALAFPAALAVGAFSKKKGSAVLAQQRVERREPRIGRRAIVSRSGLAARGRVCLVGLLGRAHGLR
eukprot:scaffold298_cov247-Pinguiococcus_pyrenoidosus.AAC.15